jgi:hypothetical protein
VPKRFACSSSISLRCRVVPPHHQDSRTRTTASVRQMLSKQGSPTYQMTRFGYTLNACHSSTFAGIANHFAHLRCTARIRNSISILLQFFTRQKGLHHIWALAKNHVNWDACTQLCERRASSNMSRTRVDFI